MSDINSMIGKRILLQLARGYGGHGAVQEYKVLEISPSGAWVKLMNPDGRKLWEAAKSLAVVETLADVMRRPQPEEAAP